ncbi:methyltransferase type 11 [Sulfuriferula multivorans]|uniref:Methyltransferase type 11 n=1 Tax=Sulfuriferula multivorans TaxID=1559896 RepID=A0A401JEQ7_9PROT|nr:methyltransferase type 11 [Sulfuriferula multivorans]
MALKCSMWVVPWLGRSYRWLFKPCGHIQTMGLHTYRYIHKNLKWLQGGAMQAAEYDAWYQTPRGRWVGETESDLLRRMLGPQSAESLLDVGCGTGFSPVGLREGASLPLPDWIRTGTGWRLPNAML